MAVEDDADALKRWLTAQPGGKAGNKAARLATNLGATAYWEARNLLVQQGAAIRGLGKGGSIRLCPLAPSPAAAPAPAPAPAPAALAAVPAPVSSGVSRGTAEPPGDEAGWYPSLLRILANDWIEERGFDDAVVEETARQGRRLTGGRWTRPDITAAALQRAPCAPFDHFEVWTFEVKRIHDLDITAVYEAAAHARAATHAVVLVCCDKQPTALQEELLFTLAEEARRQGVGLYVVCWNDPFDEWDYRVEPVASAASMADLNQFVRTQLADWNRVADWFPR